MLKIEHYLEKIMRGAWKINEMLTKLITQNTVVTIFFLSETYRDSKQKTIEILFEWITQKSVLKRFIEKFWGNSESYIVRKIYWDYAPKTIIVMLSE